MCLFFFFFKQKTAYEMRISDWSSDVCPSDLILTAGLDPLRDHGRSYAQACIEQGVPVVYREAEGNIHGFINMAKAIPSSVGDITAGLALFRQIVLHEARRLT